ncbi:RES family NAD+ phosphorylase [Paraburkholderia kirstenboschensis]|uniref:RES family NAD+ phosphorylase n=1 Tax=Paraburkholderia kirstenboschensis TaxID=1245436 RepID=A0ABZ0EA63_9BURK|nr:RES family NAD+ phosphorylase [Paraburkholderia kirstenboschensis]WOD13416.1 RES family NAD+ phosphorylase [Paraburkholderia kirstenboschensis]
MPSAHYVMIPARFPETIVVQRIDPASLPADWRDLFARAELQQVGTTWLETRASAVLAVPSAVVPAETNYLLNPNHTDFVHVEIGAREEWLTDPRLLRRASRCAWPSISCFDRCQHSLETRLPQIDQIEAALRPGLARRRPSDSGSSIVHGLWTSASMHF